jgi:hypothetical protein
VIGTSRYDSNQRFEHRRNVVRRWHHLDLVGHHARRAPEAGVFKQLARCLRYRGGIDFRGLDHQPSSGANDRFGVQELVSPLWYAQLWDAPRESAEGRAGACVGSDDVARGKELRLRDIALDYYVSRLWSQGGRVAIVA